MPDQAANTRIDYQRAIRSIQAMPAISINVRKGVQRSKKLDDATIVQVAESLGTDPTAINITKKLFAPGDPAISAILSAMRDVLSYVESHTIRYAIEPGTRLLLVPVSEDSLAPHLAQVKETRPELSDTSKRVLATKLLTEATFLEFRRQFNARKERLDSVIAHFNRFEFEGSLQRAEAWLQQRFNRVDYGDGIQLDIILREKQIVPPSYMSALSPELKAAAAAQMQSDFQTAVNYLIDQTVSDFQTALEGLRDRMLGKDGDGRPKTFRDSAVTNLKDAVEYFNSVLKARGISNSKLDEVVEKVTDLVTAIGDPRSLRVTDNTPMGIIPSIETRRQAIAGTAESIFQELNNALVVRPPRKVRGLSEQQRQLLGVA